MDDAKFIDHARNPRNAGLLEEANVVVQAGDSECSDKQIFFINIEDDKVKGIRFLIEGCDTTVATASIATELVMGQSLDTVLGISDQSIAAALGGLPEEKMHCAEMAALAMLAAVRQYRSTPRGETSYAVGNYDNLRIVAQVLNQPLAEVYSSDHEL